MAKEKGQKDKCFELFEFCSMIFIEKICGYT